MDATARRMDVDEFWRWIDLATLDLAVFGRALLAAARTQHRVEQKEARRLERKARVAAWRCANCGSAAGGPGERGAWSVYCSTKCRRAAKAARRSEARRSRAQWLHGGAP